MKTTIQVIHAQKILKELGITLRNTRKSYRGVRVRAKRYRRVWMNEQGVKRIFYEFGLAQGTLYDNATLNEILSHEAQLLAKGVKITYYKADGLIVTADLEFGYGEGTINIIGR